MNVYTGEKLELIAFQTTKEGKSICGDSYYFYVTEEYLICAIADGLGSGEHAHKASNAVVRIIENNHHEDVETLMELSNKILFGKRGAAVLIFKVFFKSNQLVCSCVGNIRFFLYSPAGKLTYPLPVTGYLSGKPQKFRTQRFTYDEKSKFLIFSDGFQIQGAKALLQQHKPVKSVAEIIYSTFKNNSDDATCIIGSLL